MANTIDFNKRVEFKRKAIKFGTSVGVTIPPELMSFIGNVDKGDELTLTAHIGKFGPFLALFKKED